MSSLPRIALAQINVTVGDIPGNVQKILTAWKEAGAQGAELVVFPELAIVGYPPEDLVLSPDFRARAMKAAHELAAQTATGPAILVGCVWEQGEHIHNAALLMDGGKITHIQPKTRLPNYGVFDEKRVFDAGGGPKVASWRGRKIGILVCEDVWDETLAVSLKEQGAELLLVLNASPFETGKAAQRLEIMQRAAKASGLTSYYVNLIGGQDDLVFDGGSFVMDAGGNVISQAEWFEEQIVIPGAAEGSKISLQGRDDKQEIYEAMKLGLRDYVRKNGFSGVLLGLSGGIDSALTAAVAADALGAENVLGVLLPSPYTSRESVEDAHELAKLLGIKTHSVPITPAMITLEETLSPVFRDAQWMEDVAVGGNVQARLRGVILMALSNKTGAMLMSTGNKSEISVGYSTLYGDACGGYNVLKDVYKTLVYTLANWRNGKGRVIPERSITKAPTAELKPGQKDQDQLPPYDVLDAILAHHIEGCLSADEIIAKGFDKPVVEKVLRMVRINEYKRRQSCPGVKISPMLFGKDRRFPLTNKAT